MLSSGLRLSEMSGQIDFTSTGDKFAWAPSRPVRVRRWGIIADALIDVGVTMIVACDFRPTIGSNASRVNGSVASGVDTAGGTITTGTTDIAAGAGVFHNVVAANGFQVDPGEEVVFEVTDAADTAGTGLVFIEYDAEPFVGEGAAGTAGDHNRIFHMTEVTS